MRAKEAGSQRARAAAASQELQPLLAAVARGSSVTRRHVASVLLAWAAAAPRQEPAAVAAGLAVLADLDQMQGTSCIEGGLLASS